MVKYGIQDLTFGSPFFKFIKAEPNGDLLLSKEGVDPHQSYPIKSGFFINAE